MKIFIIIIINISKFGDDKGVLFEIIEFIFLYQLIRLALVEAVRFYVEVFSF